MIGFSKIKERTKAPKGRRPGKANLKTSMKDSSLFELPPLEAGEARLDSEEKFYKVFSSSPDAIAISTIKDGRFIDVNDSFTRITGNTREEVIGRTTRELGHWGNIEDRDRIIRILKEKGRVSNEEVHMRVKSGEQIVALFSAEPITVDGEPCMISVTTDITERKRMEEALRESEEKFSKAFSASPNGVAITTLEDGTFLEVNDGYTRISGYTREEVIGHRSSEFGAWADAEERDRILRMLKEEGRVYNEEVRLCTKLGEVRTGLFSAEPITIGGEPCMISVATDITESKQAEEALASEAIRRRILIEHSRDGIVVLDENGKVYEANRRFAEMLGYSHEEALQLHVWDWDTQWTKEQLLDMVRSVSAAGDHFETYHRRKDGTVCDVEISTNGATFAGQKLVFCVCRDITERRVAEEKLRLLSSVTEQVSDSIIVTDTDFRITYVNKAAQELLGYSSEEALGKHMSDFDAEPLTESQVQEVRQTVSSGKTWYGTILKRRKDGSTFLAECSLCPLFDSQGQVSLFIDIERDITERRQAEEALREAEEKFSKAFSASPNMVAISTLEDGRFVEVNDSYTRINGYTREEVIGRRSTELGAWADAEERDRILGVLKEQGRVYNEEVGLCTKSGEVRICLFSSEPITIGGEPCMISVATDITKRKQAEEALRESEEFSTSLLGNAPNPITVVNPDTSIKYVNPAFEKLTGFSLEEIAGTKAPYPWWLEDRKEKRLAGLKEFMAGGSAITEQRIQNKNGEELLIELNMVRVMHDGEFKYYLAHWKDITELKKAEEALRESEEFSTGLLENAPNPITVVHPDTSVKYVNPAFEKLTGFTLDEIAGTRMPYPWWPDERKEERVANLEEGRLQGVGKMEQINQAKNGESFWVEISMASVMHEGAPRYLLANWVDLTERKQAEEALKESEEKYRDLLDNTNELIQSLTPDGRFRYVNSGWRQALGYSEDEIANLSVFDIIHPDCLQHYRMLFQKMKAGEDVGQVKATFVSKDGSKVLVEGNVTCKFVDGELVYTRGIFRDITKSKYLEEQMFRLSSAVSMSTDCIVITDFDAKIIDVNLKTIEMYGAESKEELVGRHFLELIVPEQRVAANLDVGEIIEKGHLECREYNMLSKEGEVFPVQMSTSLVRNADGEPMGMVRVGREISKLN